jgi:hypothetical protein
MNIVLLELSIWTKCCTPVAALYNCDVRIVNGDASVPTPPLSLIRGCVAAALRFIKEQETSERFTILTLEYDVMIFELILFVKLVFEMLIADAFVAVTLPTCMIGPVPADVCSNTD